MAGKERDIKPGTIEKTLKAYSLAEIAVGAIIALSPIGAPGIILILSGGAKFSLIERQKNKKQEN